MFVRSIACRSVSGDSGEYPFSVPAVRNMGSLAFSRPVTVFSGGNGCGKTTLIEILAWKLSAARIDNNHGFEGKPKAGAIARQAGAFGVACGARAKKTFYFSAEDFVRYIEWVEQAKAEARAEIARVDAELEPGSYAAKLAKMPHLHTLNDLERLYASSLAKQSHGEGFLDFFQNRITPGGLYLLDEPEGALSYENQYALSLMVMDAARQGSQFVIATHSPVVAAIPGAEIFHITDEGPKRSAYEELPNIQFLRMFMERKDALFAAGEGEE